MTELDFEELDKAVSDLMQDGGTTAGKDEHAQQHSSAPAQQAVEPVHKPVASAAMPLAMKRRGRFMDVMVRSNVKSDAADQPVKRHGITVATPGDNNEGEQQSQFNQQPVVQHSNEASTEDTQAGTNDMTNESAGFEEHHESEESDTDYAANPVPVSEWPEPEEATTPPNGDLAEPTAKYYAEPEQHDENDTDINDDQQVGDDSYLQGNAEAESEPEATQSIEQPGDAIKATVRDESLTTIIEPDAQQEDTVAVEKRDEAAPLPESVMTSPFLPDAKVDKRPLGGEAGGADSSDTSTAQKTETLPREYSSDLLTLETDGPAAAEPPEASPEQPTTPSTPPVAPQNTPAVSAAITGATAATTGGIYDTDTYHTALKQTTKTKNGWLTLIWILTLLIVGSVAGAAYYYFTTQ